MRAFVLDSFDSAPAVRDDLPAPTPADGEVPISPARCARRTRQGKLGLTLD